MYKTGPVGVFLIASYISVWTGRWFGVAGILCFLVGWYCIRYYPSAVRIGIFWSLCIVAGISLLLRILLLGSHESIIADVIIFFWVSMQYALWEVTQEEKYSWDHQERREVISKGEDFILFHAATIIWGHLTCIGFLHQGKVIEVEGLRITMETLLHMFER